MINNSAFKQLNFQRSSRKRARTKYHIFKRSSSPAILLGSFVRCIMRAPMHANVHSTYHLSVCPILFVHNYWRTITGIQSFSVCVRRPRHLRAYTHRQHHCFPRGFGICQWASGDPPGRGCVWTQATILCFYGLIVTISQNKIQVLVAFINLLINVTFSFGVGMGLQI